MQDFLEDGLIHNYMLCLSDDVLHLFFVVVEKGLVDVVEFWVRVIAEGLEVTDAFGHQVEPVQLQGGGLAVHVRVGLGTGGLLWDLDAALLLRVRFLLGGARVNRRRPLFVQLRQLLILAGLLVRDGAFPPEQGTGLEGLPVSRVLLPLLQVLQLLLKGLLRQELLVVLKLLLHFSDLFVFGHAG